MHLPKSPTHRSRAHPKSNSQGVRIGDPPARVRRLMGVPTWQGGSKFTPLERVWSYHRLDGTRKKGVEYTTLFRFRRGKLTGIELQRDLLPG